PLAEDSLGRFPDLDRAWLEGALLLPPASAEQTLSAPAGGVVRLVAQAHNIRCPHCHSPIRLVDDRPDEVLCPGCGSSFRVRDARQTTSTEGMRLGKFQLLERIGLGSFGAVWRAPEPHPERAAAR